MWELFFLLALGVGTHNFLASFRFGACGGLVYMAALVASLVADRILGSERTLFYSAILVMFGHISLAFIPGVIGLAIGLVSIAIGSGGVKTNAQVVLGQLYAKDDPRRDAGFSIFYMGVNIGELLPVVPLAHRADCCHDCGTRHQLYLSQWRLFGRWT